MPKKKSPSDPVDAATPTPGEPMAKDSGQGWAILGCMIVAVAGIGILAGVVYTFVGGFETGLLVAFRFLGIVVTTVAIALPISFWITTSREPPRQNFSGTRIPVVAFTGLMLFTIGAREGFPGINDAVGCMVCAPGYDEAFVSPTVAGGMGVFDYLTTAAWFPQCVGVLGHYDPEPLLYGIVMVGVYLVVVLLWFLIDWPVARVFSGRSVSWLRFIATPLLFALVIAGIYLYPAPLAAVTRPLNHLLASSDRPTLLHQAVEENDMGALRSRLEAGDRVNGLIRANNPPLFLALANGNAPAVEILLDHGARVTLKNHGRRTALHFAASDGDPALMRLLLDRRAPVNVVASGSETPLFVAAKWQHWEAVSLLLENGADPNLGLTDRTSSLMAAVEGNAPLEVIELLVNSGADVDIGGETLLVVAAANQPAAVVLLAEAGADVAGRHNSQTALHVLAGSSVVDVAGQPSREDAITALIEHGAEVDARDYYGRTPLWVRYDRLARLIRRGYYKGNRDELEQDLAILARLLDAGADRTSKDNRGLPAIYPISGDEYSVGRLAKTIRDH